MAVPITPERQIVRQYRVMSLSLGITRSVADRTVSATGWLMTIRISEKPKAPTSAGRRPMPPARSVLP